MSKTESVWKVISFWCKRHSLFSSPSCKYHCFLIHEMGPNISQKKEHLMCPKASINFYPLWKALCKSVENKWPLSECFLETKILGLRNVSTSSRRGKKKEKIYTYKISPASVHKSLLRFLPLSSFLSYAFTSTLSAVLQVVYFAKDTAVKCLLWFS